MKNILTTFALFFLLNQQLSTIRAQTPQGLNYQAMVRDNAGVPVTNGTSVILRFSIHTDSISGAIEFAENDSAIANQFGLVTTVIGSNASLSNVNWGSGNKFLQIETQINNSGNFVDMGTTQMQSVPYALYAANAAKLDNPVIQTHALAYVHVPHGTSVNEVWVTYPSALYNDGNSLNLSNGIFTAPADGIYLVRIDMQITQNVVASVKFYDYSIGGTMHSISSSGSTVQYITYLNMSAGQFFYLTAVPDLNADYDESITLRVCKIR